MVTLTVLMGIPSGLGASADQSAAAGGLWTVPPTLQAGLPPLLAPAGPQASPSHRSPHLGRLTFCDMGVGPHLNPAIHLHPRVGRRVRLRGSDPSPATLSCLTDPPGFPTRTRVLIYRCADLTGLSSQQRS